MPVGHDDLYQVVGEHGIGERADAVGQQVSESAADVHTGAVLVRDADGKINGHFTFLQGPRSAVGFGFQAHTEPRNEYPEAHAQHGGSVANQEAHLESGIRCHAVTLLWSFAGNLSCFLSQAFALIREQCGHEHGQIRLKPMLH
jgi:hypothetical protein